MKLDDLKALNPDQKKKLVLTALLGVMGVYALVTFGVGPYIRNAKEQAVALATLREDLDRAQRVMSRESRMRELRTEANDDLRKHATVYIPPLEAPLSWVASKVYGSARKVGVDIDSVSDLGISPMPWNRGRESSRAFVPYTVRIVTQCGYGQVVELIRELEQENPFLCISEITVQAQEGDVENHKVRLTVQWPHWGDPSEATEVTQEKRTNRG